MTRYQIVGIGNAIVDVLARTEDATLSRLGIDKGVMQLIDRDRATALLDAMADCKQIPGGSVGNTLAGCGRLGLRSAFIGRVADDALGRFYADAMQADGIDFPNPPVAGVDLPTSRSMIMVTPDGERSMSTYLGISAELGPEDVAATIAENTDYLFLEGYLFDREPGKAAFLAAARACRSGGGRAGITLSDPFCVERHRADFHRLVGDLDFVIGNEHEWATLYQTDLATALAEASRDCPLVVCTRSGGDVVIRAAGNATVVPVRPVTPVDATGAGDQFAAGFLYGLVTGRDLATAGRMGIVAAAEVIGHFGARPEADVKQLFATNDLI